MRKLSFKDVKYLEDAGTQAAVLTILPCSHRTELSGYPRKDSLTYWSFEGTP